ncbi:carabin [Echinops telfairi]|uniref:Carabin n=1 Tax=Echinops telfairi TaxID=9371 RepID=A0ABM0J349_ECHTE|nr:carabin [Echinops telfairi]
MAQALGEDLVQPSELQDDSSSLGSDSELCGPSPYRQADRYGFIGSSSAEPGPGHPSADLIRQREMKWVEMTLHWEKTMARRYKKVKIQCRKGIPSALRARCWPLLCGAHVCQENHPRTYQELASAPGDPQWMETIGRDLHRQFPLHEMFVSPQGHGQQGLLQVLKAYTLYRPEQGYCQAQGPVASVLLMHLPPELQPKPVLSPDLSGALTAGVKVLFRVGLTLVRLALGTAEQRQACPGLLETLGTLRTIPQAQLQEEAFMVQVHSVALTERDLQREIRTQLSQLPTAAPGPPPQPKARLAGAPAIFEVQQLARVQGGTSPSPEVPRIVVQPPEEARTPRRKPQTRGKTFHGLLTRVRGPPLEGPSRAHRGSSSFLDTRF